MLFRSGDQDFWNNLVRRMIVTWNAPIPDEDAGPIVNYLAKHFGPSSAHTQQVPGTQDTGSVLAIKTGLLIDGTGRPPLQNAVILVQDGKFTRIGAGIEIPQGAQIIDASGQVVMPGLIDTHVHLAEQAIVDNSPDYESRVLQDLRQNLAFGVTTIFSLGLDRDFVYQLQGRSWGTSLDGSHILTAGQGFTAPGDRKSVV